MVIGTKDEKTKKELKKEFLRDLLGVLVCMFLGCGIISLSFYPELIPNQFEFQQTVLARFLNLVLGLALVLMISFYFQVILIYYLEKARMADE